MTVSLGALRERVQQLDWVDRANVGRRWPDTVGRCPRDRTSTRPPRAGGENGPLNVRGELFTERRSTRSPSCRAGWGRPARSATSRAATCGARQARGRRLDAREPRARRSAARGASSSAAARRSGSAAATSTGGCIDSRFESWRRRSAADLKRVDYVDLRYTNGFAVGIGAHKDRRKISRPSPRFRPGG